MVTAPTDLLWLRSRADWTHYVVASALIAFLVIPTHEFGHVIGYRLTGVPATMSYAREIVPPGYRPTFLGVAGGPILTQLLCVGALVLVYRRAWLPTSYAVATLMSLDRVVLYAMQWRQLLVLRRVPQGMDETQMAVLAGLPPHFWYLALTLVFLLAWALLVRSLRYGARRNVLLCAIPLGLFLPMVALGTLVERFLFPTQFHLQFG